MSAAPLNRPRVVLPRTCAVLVTEAFAHLVPRPSASRA